MNQLPETVMWLAVGDTPYKTHGPDGEEQVCCFASNMEAYEFLIGEEPWRNSSLRIQDVPMSRAFQYAKDSGTKLLVGVEIVFDPDMSVH